MRKTTLDVVVFLNVTSYLNKIYPHTCSLGGLVAALVLKQPCMFLNINPHPLSYEFQIVKPLEGGLRVH
jgi:hypothetical protein